MTTVNDTATAAHTLKKAFFEAAKDLFSSDVVNVTFGAPGARRDLNDIVEFGSIRTEQDQANLGTNRSRNQFVYLEVIITTFRAGNAATDGDLLASDAAYELLRTLETYVRVTDTTLGGHCYWCFCETTEDQGARDNALIAKGRVVEITASFKASVRITS
jgi:hypothetical protein